MSENETIENKTAQSEPDQDIPLPEPSLTSLVTGLAAQTMVSLGIFPNPISGSTNILLNQGKHLIETVAMLDEKTKGNQTPEESQTIQNILHELRMIYVAAQNEKQRREVKSE